MLDLIYVNVIIVLFDILVVILLYLNQVGISHPVQNFSYALKLKLEFVVLNQLMAVAARGLRRESFEERRYHHSSAHDAFSAECRQWDQKAPVDPSKEHTASDHDAVRKSSSIDSAQLTVPEPVLSRDKQSSRQSATDIENYDHNNVDEKVFGAEQDLRLGNFLEDDSASSKAGELEEIRTRPSQAFSEEALRPRESTPLGDASSHIHPRRLRDAEKKALQSMRHPLRRNESHDADDGRQPMRARITRHCARRGGNGHEGEDDDDDDEIGVHLWENNGKMNLETPWFKCKVEV